MWGIILNVLSLRLKLLLSLVSLSIILGGVGIISIVSIRHIFRSFDHLVNYNTPRLHSLLEIKGLVNLIQTDTVILGYMAQGVTHDDKPAERRHELLAKVNELERLMGSYRQHLDAARTPEQLTIINNIDAAQKKLARFSLNFLEVHERGLHRENVLKMHRQIQNAQDELHRVIDIAITRELQDTTVSREQALATSHFTINLGITVWVIALLFAIALSMLLYRDVSLPLQQLRTTAMDIADGHLDKRVTIERNDEIGDLARSFNRMTGNLVTANKKILTAEKMAAVGQLAAGVAHELNNPLVVILGFAQSMISRLQPEDLRKIPLRAIERETLRCKKLIEDLLTFSQSAEMGMALSPVNINEAVETIMDFLRGEAANRGKIEVQVNKGNELPILQGNIYRIHNVIINIAMNAFDAMPHGGTLSIRTGSITEEKKTWVTLTMSDTGNGIPPDVLPHIFEPFFTTKPVGLGTGLGLSLAYEIINIHGGAIDVSSIPGHTEFYIRFPALSEVESNKA